MNDMSLLQIRTNLPDHPVDVDENEKELATRCSVCKALQNKIR